MRHHHLLALLLAPFAAIAAAADVPAATTPLNLLPWPQTLKIEAAGDVALTSATRIVTSETTLAPLAKVLAGEIQLLSGLKPAAAMATGAAGDIVLALDPALNNEAAYTLTVTDRVTITGGGYIGAAHGTSLLLQSVNRGKAGIGIPKISVSDAPYSQYYGCMVDLARQDNSIEELKGVVDMMRHYRLRFLQLHMSDDQAWTFPSTTYPQLGKTNTSTRGGPVPKVNSVAEWKELVRYADERGVTFVPEIECMGHSGAARRDLPEVFGPDVAVMNMTNPKFYPALDTILGEVADVFKSSPYIHIGCDECNIEPISRDANSKEFRAANGLKDGNDLFAWHIAKVNEIVKKHGKKTIVWEDAPLTARVPNDVAVMLWHIDGNNGATMNNLKQGRPVIQVTWTPCVYQPVKDVYLWNAWTKEMDPKLMLGGQLVLWELSGQSAVPFLRYKVSPRNERIWNPYAKLPYEDLARRLEATDAMLDNLMCGIVVQEKALVQTLGSWLKGGGQGDEGSGILPKFSFDDKSTVALGTYLTTCKIRYTLDGKAPAADSALYSGPIKLSEAKADKVTLKARLFDAAGKPLAAIWSREYHLMPVFGSVTGGLLPAADNRYGDPLTVTLKSSMTGTIRYTLDDKEPAADSAAYSKPFELAKKTATIKAALFVDGKKLGEMWKASYNWVDFAPNLTTGRPVTVSSTEGGYVGENAVDGTVDANKAWWAGPYPQWLMVDLGKVTTLDRAQVFPFWDGRRSYQYKVEVSLDNKEWKQVVDMSANTKPAVATGDMHKFAPTAGRYVRITMLKNSANPGVHLVEFRVFEAGK
ncbi:MAG: family 20 glycosylhydrolase [Verrucomicrobiota bacterium]